MVSVACDTFIEHLEQGVLDGLLTGDGTDGGTTEALKGVILSLYDSLQSSAPSAAPLYLDGIDGEGIFQQVDNLLNSVIVRELKKGKRSLRKSDGGVRLMHADDDDDEDGGDNEEDDDDEEDEDEFDADSDEDYDDNIGDGDDDSHARRIRARMEAFDDGDDSDLSSLGDGGREEEHIEVGKKPSTLNEFDMLDASCSDDEGDSDDVDDGDPMNALNDGFFNFEEMERWANDEEELHDGGNFGDDDYGDETDKEKKKKKKKNNYSVYQVSMLRARKDERKQDFYMRCCMDESIMRLYVRHRCTDLLQLYYLCAWFDCLSAGFFRSF